MKVFLPATAVIFVIGLILGGPDLEKEINTDMWGKKERYNQRKKKKEGKKKIISLWCQ